MSLFEHSLQEEVPVSIATATTFPSLAAVLGSKLK